jgi:hypothetical protein
VLASGARVLGRGRNTGTERLYWPEREDDLENEDEDGSEHGIGWYEERVCPQAVKFGRRKVRKFSFGFDKRCE